MQYRAGEGGTQTVAEEQNISPRPAWEYKEGGGGTQGQRLGQTEASDNPCGSMRMKSSLTRATVRRKKAKETEGGKKAVPPSALVLKGETDRKNGKA